MPRAKKEELRRGWDRLSFEAGDGSLSASKIARRFREQTSGSLPAIKERLVTTQRKSDLSGRRFLQFTRDGIADRHLYCGSGRV
jgi:hypothetical protein